jgi:hypothetical protein
MKIQMRRTFCIVAFVSAATAISGCSTTGGGGGGGGGDPLAQYQLDGTYPALETDVAAITTADNAAVDCISSNGAYTDQQTLDGLKAAYDGAADGFPAFVADVRTQVERRSDEICHTDLGDIPELDAVIARLTAARNRGRECQGDEPNLDDENSLQLVKHEYLHTGLAFHSITEVAVALADAGEQAADGLCAQN